jgi:hypothetical protein
VLKRSKEVLKRSKGLSRQNVALSVWRNDCENWGLMLKDSRGKVLVDFGNFNYNSN